MSARKGNRTRSAILDVALAEASVRGLETLSLGLLAQRTGLSKSGLYAHFASKEALQLEVLRTARERFVRDVVDPALARPRGEPRVRAIFQQWLRWSKELPGGCPFLATANEYDDQPGPVREALVEAQRAWVETIARAARVAIDAGHFRAELVPEQFAYDFLAIYLAFHYCMRLLRDPQAEERAHVALESLLERSRPSPSTPPGHRDDRIAT